MLKLNSITFKDDETSQIIEVNVDGSVTADHDYTSDEYFHASMFAGLVMGGGCPALMDFVNQKK